MPVTRLAAAALALLAAPGAALAACDVSVNLVTFGVVDLERDSTGTGRVVVDCDESVLFDVALGGAEGGLRRMRGPNGGEVSYRLYKDAAHAVPWGEGAFAFPGRAEADRPGTLTVHGLVPEQAPQPPGIYFDQIRVTLNF